MGYKSVILAGGRGTRLEPLTVHKTKTTRKVAGIPMIVHVLYSLEDAGVDEAHVALGYRFPDVKASINRNYRGKVETRFHDPYIKKGRKREEAEPAFLGTADAVRWLYDEMKDFDHFIIASGDHVHNLPLGEAVEKNKRDKEKGGVYATIIGFEKPEEEKCDIVNRFGQFEFNKKTGIITDFKEKPKSINDVSSGVVNTGIYVVSRELLEYLKENPQLIDFGFHVFTGDLLGEGRLGSIIFGDKYFWSDVGTIEDYRMTNIRAARGIEGIRKSEFGYDEKTGTSYGENCIIDGKVENSVIGNGVFVGEKSSVKDSVLGDNVHIFETDVSDSVIDDKVRIYTTTGMKRVCIGESAKISHDTEIVRNGLKAKEYRIIYPMLNVENTKVIDRNLTYTTYM
jgi:NDP-sugar pyrophosphorylase family protein